MVTKQWEEYSITAERDRGLIYGGWRSAYLTPSAHVSARIRRTLASKFTIKQHFDAPRSELITLAMQLKAICFLSSVFLRIVDKHKIFCNCRVLSIVPFLLRILNERYCHQTEVCQITYAFEWKNDIHVWKKNPKTQKVFSHIIIRSIGYFFKI